jgi:hypothetical protein
VSTPAIEQVRDGLWAEATSGDTDRELTALVGLLLLPPIGPGEELRPAELFADLAADNQLGPRAVGVMAEIVSTTYARAMPGPSLEFLRAARGYLR